MSSELPCPVCDKTLALHPFDVPTTRGLRRWNRCPNCHAYFDCEPFDADREVVHTRKRPWGNVKGGSELNVRKRLMYRAALQLLSRYVEPGARLLDIGCSFGGFMQEARSQGYRISGTDIVPEAVEYCRGQGFACQACGSVEAVELPDGSLDAVAALDCSYYWPNQVREFRAIRRKLKPGGLLVMRVVDKSWMVRGGLAVRRLAPGMGREICERALNDHRVSIPVRSLLRILRQEHFEILHASPKRAMNNDNASLAVKAMFRLGHWIRLFTGRFVAPGCLILARKHAG